MKRRLRFVERLEARIVLSADPVITELMAVNDSTLSDEDGDYSDWIEIFNPSTAPLALNEWALTDKADNLDKWTFPAVVMAPGDHLVVFASGKDRRDPTGQLHTDFQLSGDGEFLALVDPAGVVVSGFDPEFPQQHADFSYGAAIDITEERLVEPGDAVDVLIPADAAYGDTWTGGDETAFQTAGGLTGWTSGATGVGYDTGQGNPPEETTFTHIDLASVFNRDTIATSTSDSAGAGFRDALNEKFLRDPQFPADGLLELPNVSFQLAPYDANNSLLIDSGGAAPFDIPDATYNEISVLHSAVGFNMPYAAEQGTLTVNYTDATTDVLTWDVADNDGNNSQGLSLDALTSLTLWRFSSGQNWSNRQLWYQTFTVDGEKTVDSLEFSVAGVTDPDADFAVYAVTGAVRPEQPDEPFESFPIAIPAGDLNGDTLATSLADSAGVGYRANNEKFLTDVFPPDGVLEVPQGPTFQLEPYTQDNTVMLNLDQTTTLDIENESYAKLAVLHSAVGFNSSSTNGTLTVHYTDASSASLVWDVADNDGNNSEGMSLDALTDLTLYGANTGLSFGGRQLWYQTFDVDQTKTIESITFSTVGVVDGGGADAEFGVYAVTGQRYASYTERIETDVQADMLGVNASAYMRIPFNVADPVAFNVLTLGMQYDDGFVAHLNGVEVARRNAPEGTLPYNAAATEEHAFVQAIEYEQINLTNAIGLLESGQNVLAIHGLNLAVDDVDFFIRPQLTAANVTVMSDRVYFEEPTPGALNNSGFTDFVDDTKFSVDRGFFNAPFDVEIATTTEGADIYYTVDGSAPSPDNGTLYGGPIGVSSTTTLRAAAFKDGYRPTNVDTQTYIFIADVLTQPATRAGYAQPMMQSRGGGTPLVQLDFEVDPDIVNDPAYHDDFIAGLTAIPSMSIVMDVDDLLGSNSFYDKGGSANNGAFERPASVEIIDPAHPEDNMQVNAGIRPHSHQLVKRSLQLLFKNEYGAGKLNSSLFSNAILGGEDASESINRIVLRAGHNRSFVHYWNPDDSSYTRDEWVRITRDAMSGNGSAAHGNFVHLYINGMYWGLYNPLERPDAAFSAEYFGGDPDDWYARNHGDYGSGGETVSGDSSRFDYLVGPLKDKDLSQPANYAEFQQYLEVQQFADYVMLNFFGGNADWPHNNFYGGNRNGDDPTPFVYYDWDAEGFLDGRDASGPFNQPGGRGNAGSWVHPNFVVGASPASDVAALWHAARTSPEFMMMFADRVYQHTSHGGALTDEQTRQRWLALNDYIQDAIIGESARWGDVREAFDGVVRDREVWQSDVDRVDDMLDGNAAALIDALRTQGYYPDVDPPQYNQHGGPVPAEFELTMNASQEPGFEETSLLTQGAAAKWIVPTDESLGLTWTELGFDDTGWSVGDTGIGYEDTPGDFVGLIGTSVRPQDAGNEFLCTYLRIPFTVADAVDYVTLRMKYDDGFVAYINGSEVARGNFTGTPAFDSTTENRPDAEAVVFQDITIPTTALQTGSNVLAIHGINKDASSSDMLILPELVVGAFVENPDGPPIWFTTDGSDPRLPGGGVSPAATEYTSPVPLAETTSVKARVLEGGEWSAVNEATFVVNPATSENLVVSEIHFNPAGGSDYEFIELMNISAEAISLADVAFAPGDPVDFTFADGSVFTLEAGETVLVVKNLDAFRIRYGTGLDDRIAGVFDDGGLSNGGEQISLLGRDGALIRSFSYDDNAPWPSTADGLGYSLVLKDPASNPDHANPYNWWASAAVGGSPGAVDPAGPAGIVISEALTNSDGALVDTIELFNPTGGDVDVGGWYLTDDENLPQKYQIADPTIIPAGSYVTFDETQFNASGGVDPNDFALGATGDEVFLFSANPATSDLTGYVHGFAFGAAADNVAFIRHVDSTGYEHFTAQAEPGTSLGGANEPFRVGKVVITELHYNPKTSDPLEPFVDEFIEIQNISDVEVPLFDPDNPANMWVVNGAAFAFPPAASLAPAEVALVVSIDPETFRATYSLPAELQIFGPFLGSLSDGGETISLQRPTAPAPETPLIVPLIDVDVVRYDDDPSWTTLPDGGNGDGSSLTRLAADNFGSDPLSWTAAEPTPGDAFTIRHVVGRHLFYGGSTLDTPDHVDAIAVDKSPLLPGKQATFANYTSYAHGINGLIIDLINPTATPTAGDFTFRVGNVDDTSSWQPAPAPLSFEVDDGGAFGSTRVTVTWANGAITGQWIETAIAASLTGAADFFYYGNAIGETGNAPSNALVTAADLIAIRNSPRGDANRADITTPYDINRDAEVNAIDALLARNAATGPFDALRLITPVLPSPTPSEAEGEQLLRVERNDAPMTTTLALNVLRASEPSDRATTESPRQSHLPSNMLGNRTGGPPVRSATLASTFGRSTRALGRQSAESLTVHQFAEIDDALAELLSVDWRYTLLAGSGFDRPVH